MKKTLSIFGLLFIMLASMALAQESEELPIWFRLFEPVGVIIAVIAVIYMIGTYARFAGKLKTGYGLITLGTASVALSMVWKAIAEAGIVAEGLASEAVLELFIILGILVIAFGSKKISDAIKSVAKGR